MKSFNLLIFILLLTFVSCGESTKSGPEKKSEKESILDGFWVRKGTLQVVNNVTVDTLFYGKDIEGMKNVKAFSNGSIFWINNSTDENNPWTRGNGGYGKFEVTNDTLTEFMSHGSGGMGAAMRYFRDSLNQQSIEFNFAYNLNDNYYTQFGGAVPDSENKTSYAEYYEKLPSLRKSKIDGVWKRVYEISYVNGIAVDTTSVPTDAILDVKVFKDGYFLVQVDVTRLVEDPSKPEYGGGGNFGQFEYDGNGNLVEYGEFTSGNWRFPEREPRDKRNAHYAAVSFYDDDLYIQITKDTLNQGQAGRGVVYARVK